MHLAKRAALAAAILFLSVGLTACKKKEKDGEKKEDPTAKGDEKGSGSASGSGSAAAKPDEAKPADAALKGFKGAMAEASGKGEGGLMGKAKGGLGASLGALFGGGTAAAAETAQDTDRHAMGKGQDPSAVEEEAPPTDEGDDVKGQPVAAPAAIEFPPAGQPGGDCAAVTDRLMVIITQMMGSEMGTVGEAEQTEMRTMISTMCTEQNWSQELKDCALAAMSEADLDACEKYAPADMDKGEEVAGEGDYEAGEDYPAEPAKPAPAWTGGDSCKDVGDRLIQLSIAQMGELPPESLKEMESSLAEAADQVKQMCEEMKWSDTVRKCILAAPTIDDTGSCLNELSGDM